MARSRNIKPGFFLNEKLAEIEPLGRLLFAGLWCLADREGRLQDRPRRIKVETLPYDNCDVDKLLCSLAEKEFIIRYEVNDKKYIQIVNFLKHQSPHHKEVESAIPPPCAEQGFCNDDSITTQDCAKHESSMTTQASIDPPDSLNLIPDSLVLISDSLNLIDEASTTEISILQELEGIHGYPFDKQKDLDYVRMLLTEFADVDVLSEVKRWAVYKLDKPLKKNSNARLQFRNWLENARRYAKEREKSSPRNAYEDGLSGAAEEYIRKSLAKQFGEDWDEATI